MVVVYPLRLFPRLLTADYPEGHLTEKQLPPTLTPRQVAYVLGLADTEQLALYVAWGGLPPPINGAGFGTTTARYSTVRVISCRDGELVPGDEWEPFEDPHAEKLRQKSLFDPARRTVRFKPGARKPKKKG